MKLRHLFFLLACLTSGAAAAPLGPGDELPPLELRDQHDETHRVSAETRTLLFAPDRESAQLVTSALEGQDAAALAERGIRYLADISGMPGIITQLFALPKLRERPYPILLAEEPEQVSHLPRRAEQVTLLRLDDGTIVEVDYLDSVPTLRKALDLPEAD